MLFAFLFPEKDTRCARYAASYALLQSPVNNERVKVVGYATYVNSVFTNYDLARAGNKDRSNYGTN